MMSEGLARAWESQGHSVTVMTDTPRNGHDEHRDLKVVRRPSIRKRLRLAQEVDVFVRSGNSLQSLPWPMLARTPHVTIHHRPLAESHMESVRILVERGATYLCHNVAVSNAVAETIPGRTTTIPNTFQKTFDQPGADEGNREGLLLVGRLVSRKGVDVAIEALHYLRNKGVEQTLTICGNGPDREMLEKKVQQLVLEDAVCFEGWASPEELANKYRKAAVTLVPSRKEPFGIVALESIASRCPVVASDVGGLPEAVGDCGLLVDPDNPEALADGIEKALQPDIRASLRVSMPEHVNRHRIGRIADEYIEVLTSVANGVGR